MIEWEGEAERDVKNGSQVPDIYYFVISCLITKQALETELFS